MNRSESLAATTDRLDDASGWYSFVGTPRSSFAFNDFAHRDPDNGTVPVRPVATETTFIAPKFVTSEEQDPGRALRIGADKLALVANDSGIDHATADLLITATSLEGTKHWTTTFKDCDLAGAWMVDQLLVFAIRGHEHAQGTGVGEIVAVDPADGRIVWRTAT